MASLANLFKFHYLTQAQYAALETKDTSAIYFASDTGKIYKGSEDFTKSVRFVAEFPSTAIAQGILYVNTTTGEGRTYNGAEWLTVVRATDTTVTENSTNTVTSGAVYTAIETAKTAIGTGKISSLDTAAQGQVILGGATANAVTASGKTIGAATITYDAGDNNDEASASRLATEAAVVAAIDEAVGEVDLTPYVTTITWDGTNTKLVVTKNGTPADLPLNKIGVSIGYDGATGRLSLKDKDNTVLSYVDIPVDNFVESGTYNGETQKIVLTLRNNDTVEIPASDLIDTIYGDQTSTVTTTVYTDATDGNKVKVKADIKIATAADAPNNALQVHANGGLYVDISGKADKAIPTAAGEVSTLDATGNLVASGKTIGGNTITTTNDAGDGNKLATEAGVVAFVADQNAAYVPKSAMVTDITTGTPDDNTVATTAAIIDALSWQLYT